MIYRWNQSNDYFRCLIAWKKTIKHTLILEHNLIFFASPPQRCQQGSAAQHQECMQTNSQFADKFTISASGRTVTEAAVRLSPALREVEKWSADYENLLSTEKTAALVETTGNASTGLSFLGTPIQNNEEINILGVHMDTEMSFKKHASGMAKKINKRTQISSRC